MTLKESIRFHTEEAEKMKLHRKVNEIILGTETYEIKLQEHTQTAEWLKELAERRKQPEQKTGHWIEASVAGMPALYHEKCGAFVYAPNGKKGFNFCPNCGADMRGEQE